MAAITSMAFGDQVVARTNQLEVIYVIQNRDALRAQLPKYRRGQVMIDVANVGNIGPKLMDDLAQLLACLTRVQNVCRHSRASNHAGGFVLEVDVRHE